MKNNENTEVLDLREIKQKNKTKEKKTKKYFG